MMQFKSNSMKKVATFMKAFFITFGAIAILTFCLMAMFSTV